MRGNIYCLPLFRLVALEKDVGGGEAECRWHGRHIQAGVDLEAAGGGERAVAVAEQEGLVAGYGGVAAEAHEVGAGFAERLLLLAEHEGSGSHLSDPITAVGTGEAKAETGVLSDEEEGGVGLAGMGYLPVEALKRLGAGSDMGEEGVGIVEAPHRI